METVGQRFKAGQKVNRITRVFGAIIHQEYTVSKINEQGVWLELPGGLEGGPFDSVTGERDGGFFGPESITEL